MNLSKRYEKFVTGRSFPTKKLVVTGRKDNIGDFADAVCGAFSVAGYVLTNAGDDYVDYMPTYQMAWSSFRIAFREDDCYKVGEKAFDSMYECIAYGVGGIIDMLAKDDYSGFGDL